MRDWDDTLVLRLEHRLDAAVARALAFTMSVPSTVDTKRRKLARSLPERVEASDNACARDLRAAVILRKITNGHGAMSSAEGEAAVRTAVTMARMTLPPARSTAR